MPGLVASGLVAVAGVARAQSTSWHATATGDVAVTDNVFAAPNDGSREGDLFFQLRPGGIFTYNGPRMVHELSLDGEAIQYALHSRRPSLSARGGWRSIWLPGPDTELMTSVNGGSGEITSLGSRTTPDESLINVAPVGKVSYVSADASQYLSYVLTEDLRFSETAFGRWNRSNDNAQDLDPAQMDTITKSAEAGMAIGLDRSWSKDALSIEVGAAVSRLERIAPDTARPDQGSRLDQQINPRGRAQWRHDLDQRLSFAIDGGLVMLVPFGKDPYNPDLIRQRGVFPVVGGTFALTEPWGRAQMSLRRDITPNLFLAQQTANDSATVSVAMPLPWIDDSHLSAPKWNGVGSVGVQRTQIIDSESSKTTSSVGAGRVDLAVVYTPRPGISYAARYELTVQTGDSRATVPLEGYFRNTVYFTFNIRYPNRLAGAVPKRKAGGGVRADGTDLNPIGAEPVVPDVVE